MAVAAGSHVYKNMIIEIDEVEYKNQARVARLVPDVPIQTYRVLDPTGTTQDVDTPVWTFELTGLQVNAAGGLAKALRALPVGELVEVILAPQNTVGEDKATFNILVIPPAFGGEQGSYGVIEMVFPVIGSPVFSAISA